MILKKTANLPLKIFLLILFSPFVLFAQIDTLNTFPILPLSQEDSVSLQEDNHVLDIDIFDCKSSIRDKEWKIYKKFSSITREGRLYDLKKYAIEIHPESRYYHPIWAEYFWLKNEDIKAREHALSSINLQPTCFPIIYYLLGEISYRMKDYVLATKSLKNALELDLEEPFLSKAKKYYFKAEIIAQIIENPVSFSPKVILGISTENDEYLPVISPDQELAFYTRRYLKEGIDMLIPSYTEEFTYSEIEGSQFNSGRIMPLPFNTLNNEGGATISLDNKTLYFTRCSKTKGYNNCDIFYSHRKDDKWQKVKAFNDNINMPFNWESQPSISADGNSIVFASDRKGGYGGVDLYIIYKKEDGKWTTPENLGDKINSKYQEKSPFLHVDGQTLFFASTRFPSIGGYDIFYSRKDSLGDWQEVKNIGYPINTISDEIALFVSTDGKYAYFASNQLKGVGGWDIYSFPLHKEAKPKKVLFLKGNLTDNEGNLLEDVELELQNIRTNKKQEIFVEKGSYVTSFTLEDDDDVLLTIKKDGFAFNSRYISSKDSSFFSPSNLDFKLETIENGKSFRLNNIYFETNSSEINDVTKYILTAFSNYLQDNIGLRVAIHGHTDNIGREVDNLKLSNERAYEVYSFITSQGVSKDRLSYKGFGENIPIQSNSNKEGRSQNRRTEFLILAK